LTPRILRETPGGLGAEAPPVADEATATREKIRSQGYGSTMDDYIFEWGYVRSCLLGNLNKRKKRETPGKGFPLYFSRSLEK
jgi:hypothetical protein